MATEYRNYDVISIKNISDEDFTFEYDRSSGNLPYIIPAGEIRRYPRFLARHAVKHLIDKILTDRKQKTNNQPLRNELASQIIIDEESFRSEGEQNEAEKLKAQVDELNKPSEIDRILNKRKEEAKALKQPPLAPEPEEAVNPSEETFEGAEEGKEAHTEEEIDLTEPKEKESKEVKAMPTRNELYDYAKKNNLILDEKDKEGKTLRQRLDKMKIPDIIKEIDYPQEG